MKGRCPFCPSVDKGASRKILAYLIPLLNLENHKILSGGPTKCDNKDFPKNFTCNTNEEISESITLCGKPQPTMSWMVGDQSFNGTVDLTKADQHQYTYSFKRTITSDLCGKNISYQATGFHNISGSSLILLKKCKFIVLYFFLLSPFH